METTAETAVQARMRDVRVHHATTRLLDKLRKWTRAYQRLESDQMPEHEIVFVTGVDGGPERELVDAMKATPALWLQALPEHLAIVPRARLSDFGVDASVVKYMEHEAARHIEAESARLLREEQYRR